MIWAFNYDRMDRERAREIGIVGGRCALSRTYNKSFSRVIKMRFCWSCSSFFFSLFFCAFLVDFSASLHCRLIFFQNCWKNVLKNKQRDSTRHPEFIVHPICGPNILPHSVRYIVYICTIYRYVEYIFGNFFRILA